MTPFFRHFLLLSLLLSSATLSGFDAFSQEGPTTEDYVIDENRAYFETSYGDFVIKFHSEEAPLAVSQLKKLVRLGLYNGVDLTSASPSYFVQIDDVTNQQSPLLPSQSSALKELKFEDSGFPHERGAVSLTLHEGKDVGESALTIFMGPSPDLDGSQSVVGEIEFGMDVLSKIENLDADDSDFFKSPVRILSAVMLSPEEAQKKFLAGQSGKSSLQQRKFALYSFAFILLITVVSFLLYGKVSPRSQVAFAMIVSFISAFSVLALLGGAEKEQPLVGAVLFFSFVSLYKFLNRFESQRP